jgi:hypothetical protein
MPLTKIQYSNILDIFEPKDISKRQTDQVKNIINNFIDQYNFCGSRSNFQTLFNRI